MDIKNVVLGRVIERSFYTHEFRDRNGQLESRPTIIYEKDETKWEEICSFYTNEIQTNRKGLYYSLISRETPIEKRMPIESINIDKDKEIEIFEIKFRADLNEVYWFSKEIIKINEDEKSREETYSKNLWFIRLEEQYEHYLGKRIIS